MLASLALQIGGWHRRHTEQRSPAVCVAAAACQRGRAPVRYVPSTAYMHLYPLTSKHGCGPDQARLQSLHRWQRAPWDRNWAALQSQAGAARVRAMAACATASRCPPRWHRHAQGGSQRDLQSRSFASNGLLSSTVPMICSALACGMRFAACIGASSQRIRRKRCRLFIRWSVNMYVTACGTQCCEHAEEKGRARWKALRGGRSSKRGRSRGEQAGTRVAARKQGRTEA